MRRGAKSARASARRSMTLVEALVVCALLAIAAGLAAGLLGGAAESTAWRRAEAEVVRFDALARMSARTGGAVACSVEPPPDGAPDEPGAALVARPSAEAGGGGGGVLRVAMPEGLLVRMEPGTVAIDALGRSADVAYAVLPAPGAGGARGELRVEVAGATGIARIGRVGEAGGPP